MTLLAIDTSADQCAVCLYNVEADHVLAQASENIARGHAEKLMPIMAECLDSAVSTYDDITKIAVTIGPGSFTGVRVGLSAARGLALSLNIPICAISTLEACIEEARLLGHYDDIATIIDARRNEAFVQLKGEAPFIVGYDKISHHLQNSNIALCGSGAEIFNEISKHNHKIIHSRSTGNIETIAKIVAKKNFNETMPEPLYLRSADAKPQSGFTLERA